MSQNSVLIIGAGGVGSVAVKKCAALPEVFHKITLASRTKEKCDKIASEIDREIQTAQVDADDSKQVADLIRKTGVNLVINLALPYQDLPIMDACLETGVDYLDTANYEPKDVAKFEYSWQWAYREKFKEKGIMALLGSGFDPGVTNIFCAYAQKHYFDEIEYIDILDCNGGDHGKAFATNFNPEINIREITQNGRYWENGEWIETKPMEIKMDFNFEEVGVKKAYLLYHEELESLVENIKGLKRIRFWMTFGEEYIKHLEVLQNVGMTRIDEVEYNGQKIVPLQFLKAVLPEPSSLGEGYTGKTNIGCIIRGKKDGKDKSIYIKNICDHAECYREVGSQAVSYTTGVPAMIGAKMMLEGKWKKDGVYNIEEFNPDPFMDDLMKYGLPWKVEEWKGELPV